HHESTNCLSNANQSVSVVPRWCANKFAQRGAVAVHATGGRRDLVFGDRKQQVGRVRFRCESLTGNESGTRSLSHTPLCNAWSRERRATRALRSYSFAG